VNDQVPGNFAKTCKARADHLTGCFEMGVREVEVYGTTAR